MRLLFLYLIMLGCVFRTAAQHLDDLMRHQGWLSSANAAGLCRLGDGLRLNDATVTYRFGQGDLTDYYTPQRSIEWDGRVKSLSRLSAHTVLSGAVSYGYQTGYEMAGSAWIDPTDKPFDLMEYTEGREGRKILEHYELQGAVSHEMGRWAVGVKGDYQAANYAKQRDLRHQNRQMQLSLSPGVIYHLGRLDLGVNYLYRRRTEGLSFNMAGNTDQQYISLVSYGAFLGMREYSATLYDGYTSVSSGDRPLVDQWNGVAVQVGWQGRGWQWFNELACDFRSGYYGRQTTYTIVYEDHDGMGLDWRSTLGLGAREDGLWSHLVHAEVGYRTLLAKERLWNEVQQGGGLTEYVYYDKQQRLDRNDLTASLAYEYRLKDWRFGAGGHFARQHQEVSYYPLYRLQTIQHYGAYVEAQRLWQRRAHRWEATLRLAWQQGQGTMANDGTYGGAMATTQVVSHDAYLRQAFAYQTAQQGQLGATVRYQHPQRWYTQAEYSLRRRLADNPDLGKDFYQLGVAIGYEF